MTGYIQLELGGKKRGVKFGNYALFEYSKITNSGVAEFNEQNPIKLCADLIYCGLKNNCLIKREIEDFTYQDVIAWVDDMPIDKITEITQIFEQSINSSRGVNEIQEAMSSNSKGSKSPKK
jgi:hypothetical protein